MPVETQKKWSDKELILLEKLLVKGTYSYLEMCKFFPDRTIHSIENKTFRLGLSNKYRPIKYTYNEHYFSEITLQNCYYAGVFSADASVVPQTLYPERLIFKWAISEIDKKLMESFIQKINYTGPIKYYSRKNPKSNNISKMISISLNRCSNIAKDLENNFGIVPNKTYRLMPPNIMTLEQKLAFIVGYIDGDGCITGNKDQDNYNMTIAFTSSGLKMLEWIQQIIESLNLYAQIPRKNTIHKLNHAECYVLRYSGSRAVQLYRLLKAVPVEKLERKWNTERILKYMSWIEKNRPKWLEDDILKRLNLNFTIKSSLFGVSLVA